MSATRPIAVLIAALGGEGGGVLTDWIVTAAMAEGYPVQRTSIPGVAQRTGATTYYIEVYPERGGDPGRRPVMALYPGPGNIDIMVCSELLEAGRAMESGYVSPERTTLIAATHRVFSIAEKSAMADGRYDTDKVVAAAGELARRAILADFAALARREGTIVNAVLMGAIAGAGALPMSPGSYENAIRAGGIAVEGNLRGFRAGLARARGETAEAEEAPAEVAAADRDDRVAALPAPVRPIAAEGVKRLIDYQDRRLAEAYLDRLARIVAADDAARDFALGAAAARHLALWMSYEDVIRVAELKTRRSRFDRVRRETGAKAGEPVHVTEFLKPGPEEIAAILTPGLGRRLRAWAAAHGGEARWQRSVRLRTDTLSGFLRLWTVARLKGWRRRTLRYAEEEAAIERWLKAITEAAAIDYDLALEIAVLPKLLKGYSDTHARGRRNYAAVFDRLVEPALAGSGPGVAVQVVRRAREAALADPEGFALDRVLAENADHDADRPSSNNAAAANREQGGQAA